METRARRDLELAEHAFVRVDLLEAAHDLLGVRLDRERHGEGLVAGRRRARELVRDDLVHAADLLEHGPAEILALLARFELAAHDRERRLEAVREIGERVAVALEAIALGVDERIEARRQARQLRRVGAPEMILAAALDAREVGGHLAKRRHAPAQHDDEEKQQHDTGRTEPDRERAPVDVDLLAEAADVLGDVERQMQRLLRRAAGRVPVDALRHHEEIALGRMHRSREAHFTARQRRVERKIAIDRGRRAPLVALRTDDLLAEDAGVEARLHGPVEARIRPDFGRQQRAAARCIGRGEVRVDVLLQPVSQRALRGIVERAVEREERKAEKRREHAARGREGSRLQG